jgi:hypothetical protein
MTKLHPCEPSLEELKQIQRDLFRAESTDENVARLKAIEHQIARHQAAQKEQEAEEKGDDNG